MRRWLAARLRLWADHLARETYAEAVQSLRREQEREQHRGYRAPVTPLQRRMRSGPRPANDDPPRAA